MLWELLLQAIAGFVSLWLADRFISGVEFHGLLYYIPKSVAQISNIFSTMAFVGAFLGFLNYFVKPILNKITLPLRIITLNLFSLVIAMFLVWIVDIFFIELSIQGIRALFWTTVILWVVTLITSRFSAKKS